MAVALFLVVAGSVAAQAGRIWRGKTLDEWIEILGEAVDMAGDAVRGHDACLAVLELAPDDPRVHRALEHRITNVSYSVDMRAAMLCYRIGRPARELLARALPHANPVVLRYIARGFARCGKDAATELARQLPACGATQRSIIAIGLAEEGAGAAAFLAALEAQSATAREVAAAARMHELSARKPKRPEVPTPPCLDARAIARLKAEVKAQEVQDVDPILAVLSLPPVQQVAQLASAGVPGLTALVELCESGTVQFRGQLARSFPRFVTDDPATLSALHVLLDRFTSPVKEADVVPPSPLLPLWVAEPIPLEGILTTCARIGRPSVGTLKAILRTAQPAEARAKILITLAAIGHDAGRAALSIIEQLDDPSRVPYVRCRDFYLRLENWYERPLPPIDSANWGWDLGPGLPVGCVQDAAIHALARIGPAATDVLERSLASASGNKAGVLAALAGLCATHPAVRLTPDTTARVRGELANRDVWVVRHAESILRHAATAR